MFSESDFESFLQTVIYKSKLKAEKKIKKAEDVYRKKIEEARREGEKLFESEIESFKEYLETEKTRRILEIQMLVRKRENEEIGKIIQEVKRDVRSILEERFEDYLVCFSRWLKKRFKEGTVHTPERWSHLFKDFDLRIDEKDKVVFEKDQVYISFSADDIFRMYEGKIDALVLKYIKG
ncbi:hypothetical protein [Persephonella sp.]